MAAPQPDVADPVLEAMLAAQQGMADAIARYVRGSAAARTRPARDAAPPQAVANDRPADDRAVPNAREGLADSGPRQSRAVLAPASAPRDRAAAGYRADAAREDAARDSASRADAWAGGAGSRGPSAAAAAAVNDAAAFARRRLV